MKKINVVNAFLMTVLLSGANTAFSVVPDLEPCPNSSINLDSYPLNEVGSGTLRYDYYLPKSQYNEPTNYRIEDGKRVQIVVTAKNSGYLRELKINGRDARSLVDESNLDWYNVWPRSMRENQTINLAFHSMDPSLNTGNRIQVTGVGSDGQILFDRSVQLESDEIRFNYITTRDNYRRIQFFVENTSRFTTSILEFILNGRNITSGLCFYDSIIGGNNRVRLIEVLLDRPLVPGQELNAVMRVSRGQNIVGHTRVLPERFIVSAWTDAEDCAFPNLNEGNFNRQRDAGFNTIFLQPGERCGKPDSSLWEALKGRDFFSFIDEGVRFKTFSSQRDGIAARHLADEVDQGDPKEALKRFSRSGWDFWQAEPDIPTFIGASRNTKVGRFAGLADIQAIDIYAAACAPHITPFGTIPTLTAPFDYTRIARLNQAPMTTWTYTQGFSQAWNRKPPLGGTRFNSPLDYELLVQAAASIAGGAKSLLWFQTSTRAFSKPKYEGAYYAMGDFNRSLRAIGESIRTSEPAPIASSGNPGIKTQALISSDRIIVIAMNQSYRERPSDTQCALGYEQHWKLNDIEGNVAIQIPDQFGVTRVGEMERGSYKSVDYRSSNRQITIPFRLTSNRPIKIFVLDR